MLNDSPFFANYPRRSSGPLYEDIERRFWHRRSHSKVTAVDEELARIYRIAAWMDANITNVTLDEWLTLGDRLRDETNALIDKHGSGG